MKTECKYPQYTRLSAYGKGCRCKACRNYVSEYHRIYRRNNPKIIRAIRARSEARKAKNEQR